MSERTTGEVILRKPTRRRRVSSAAASAVRLANQGVLGPPLFSDSSTEIGLNILY